MSVFHISRAELPGAVITILSYFKSIYHNSNKGFVRFHQFSPTLSQLLWRHSTASQYRSTSHIYTEFTSIICRFDCLSIIISHQRCHFKTFSGYKCVIKLFTKPYCIRRQILNWSGSKDGNQCDALLSHRSARRSRF